MYLILSKSLFVLGLLALCGSRKSEDSSHDEDEQNEDSDDVKSKIESVHDRFGHLKSNVYTDQSLVVLFGCLQQAYELHECQVKELKKLVDPKPKQVCPANFTHISSSNKCYKLEFDQMDWNDARIRCKNLHRDAHLVVVDDASEQSVIVTYLTSLKARIQSKCYDRSIVKVWTAAQRIDPSRNSMFMWKPFDSMVEMKYTDWLPGQPDFTGNREFCAHFHSFPDLKWNDIACGASDYCPFCEIDL